MKHRNPVRAEEMELAITLWQESGLSKYTFCKNEKIDRTTFNYWLVKYGYKLNKPLTPKPKVTKPGSKTKSSFVPVNVSSQDQLASSTLHSGIELEYPNGVKLRLPHELNYEQLHSLITMY